jgi:hypothetical protein
MEAGQVNLKNSAALSQIKSNYLHQNELCFPEMRHLVWCI